MKTNAAYNREKFFRKNLLTFIIPAIIPLIILGIFSIVITQGYVKDEINQNSFNLLKQTSQQMDLILNDLNTLSLNFDTNPDFIVTAKNILNKNSLSLEDSKQLTIMKSFMESAANVKPYIHSIYAYYNNDQGKLISTFSGLTSLSQTSDPDWFRSFNQNRGKQPIWSEIRQVKNYSFEQATPILTVYKNLFSPGMHEADGVLVLNLKPVFLEQMLSDLLNYRDQSLVVLNEDNRVIASSNLSAQNELPDLSRITRSEDSFFTLQTSSKSYIATKYHSETSGWSYISVIPTGVLYEVPGKLLIFTIILLLLSIAMGVIPTFHFTRKNYRNVKKIMSLLESAKHGEPVPMPISKVKDEYSYIIQSLIKTFLEQNFLKTQLSERKYRMQVLELLALQSQMNPHFLFNTLHTLNWKSIGLTGKPNEVSEMIENLATILEYSFRDMSGQVSMEEEVEHTQNYLAIQKARYGDKFDVVWVIDEELKPFPVMKLLLQPLTENSIYHGLKEKEGSGVIQVRIERKHRYIRIFVIDNGLGIEPAKYAEIREKLKSDIQQSAPRHIGLLNTNKRLMLTYGEASRLRIRSRYGIGTTVLIQIPIQEDYDI